MAEIRRTDLALSGPHVWPTIAATSPAARFIHRRPEIAYLRAREQLDPAIRPDERQIEVILRQIFRKNSSVQVARWKHQVLPKPIEDVTRYLKTLYQACCKALPQGPELETIVQVELHFKSANGPDTKSWRAPWL